MSKVEGLNNQDTESTSRHDPFDPPNRDTHASNLEKPQSLNAKLQARGTAP